jgi:hypothetical protein
MLNQVIFLWYSTRIWCINVNEITKIQNGGQKIQWFLPKIDHLQVSNNFENSWLVEARSTKMHGDAIY